MRDTNPFHTARQAKEFIVSRIVDEALREGVALSEAERKLLYHSEMSGSTPDDPGISDEEYENKISSLIKHAVNRARRESSEEFDMWWAAIRLLKKQDHYVLVMIARARLRPPGDLLKLWCSGFAIVGLLMGGFLMATFVSDRYKITWPSREAFGFYTWVGMISVAVAYGLLGLILGWERITHLTNRLLGRLFGPPDRKG